MAAPMSPHDAIERLVTSYLLVSNTQSPKVHNAIMQRLCEMVVRSESSSLINGGHVLQVQQSDAANEQIRLFVEETVKICLERGESILAFPGSGSRTAPKAKSGKTKGKGREKAKKWVEMLVEEPEGEAREKLFVEE